MLNNNTRAVIWDLDGVIADTAHYHFRAWQEAWHRRGVRFTKADFQQSFGQRNESIIRNILGKATTEQEINDIATYKEASFRRRIKGYVKALPGAVVLMAALNKASFKMALASSTPIANIRLVLHILGIKDYFGAIVAAEDVHKGKPDPQCFQLAARLLRVEPIYCLVIEDAVTGVTAAKKAGMRCLAVTTTHPLKSLMAADLIVDSLEMITTNDVERLLNLPSK